VTEFVLEQRLRQLRDRGNTIFPMLDNKKYFLRTWYTGTKNQVKLELISGYGFNESKTFYTLDQHTADSFFLEMGFGKQAKSEVAEENIFTKPQREDVNNSLHRPKYFNITIPKSKRNYKYSLRMSEVTENNIGTLRTKLFSAIEKLENGTMKHEEAKAMASLAQTVINSAKLELDYKRMVEKTPDIKMLNS